MQDEIARYPGRIRLVPVSGTTSDYDVIDISEPLVEGTDLSKAVLFSQEAADRYNLTGDAATPSNAFLLTAKDFDVLPILRGGTGAVNADMARMNLLAAALEHTHRSVDIDGTRVITGITDCNDAIPPPNTRASYAINANVPNSPTAGRSHWLEAGHDGANTACYQIAYSGHASSPYTTHIAKRNAWNTNTTPQWTPWSFALIEATTLTLTGTTYSGTAALNTVNVFSSNLTSFAITSNPAASVAANPGAYFTTWIFTPASALTISLPAAGKPSGALTVVAGKLVTVMFSYASAVYAINQVN